MQIMQMDLKMLCILLYNLSWICSSGRAWFNAPVSKTGVSLTPEVQILSAAPVKHKDIGTLDSRAVRATCQSSYIFFISIEKTSNQIQPDVFFFRLSNSYESFVSISNINKLIL